MPHVVLAGRADLAGAWRGLPRQPWRWGQAVARVEGCYLGHESLLVAGVVVEYGRPLHPVVLVSCRGDETVVRLWPRAEVERTLAVKRFVARVAQELSAHGTGEVVSTNIPDLLR
ncbi:MAG: hypothetical protein V1750_10265 [Acidobacteriota bacterium]